MYGHWWRGRLSPCVTDWCHSHCPQGWQEAELGSWLWHLRDQQHLGRDPGEPPELEQPSAAAVWCLSVWLCVLLWRWRKADAFGKQKEAPLPPCDPVGTRSSWSQSHSPQASDARRALEETMALSTQSLASVTYQVSSLASTFLRLLDLQAAELRQLEATVSCVAQKIVPPPSPPCLEPYYRRPLSFSILDDIGHGMKEKCPCPRARPAARGARGQALHGLLLLLAGICQPLMTSSCRRLRLCPTLRMWRHHHPPLQRTPPGPPRATWRKWWPCTPTHGRRTTSSPSHPVPSSSSPAATRTAGARASWARKRVSSPPITWSHSEPQHPASSTSLIPHPASPTSLIPHPASPTSPILHPPHPLSPILHPPHPTYPPSPILHPPHPTSPILHPPHPLSLILHPLHPASPIPHPPSCVPRIPQPHPGAPSPSPLCLFFTF
ncbi:ABI gene family member 3 isoform X3 [Columba livia]|uniref:ABI gene family member 3 isoform X3 n=1 Tax=Columba livia TaxID=8932 RepID=UPI0031BB1C34